MLSSLEATIIAITLQALLTGVYFTSFLLCLRWLIFSDDGGTLRKPIHRPFLIITVILFTFSVTDLGFSLQATLLFSQVASILDSRVGIAYAGVINWVIEMLTSIIIDGVLIFRCWSVYNRSWRIAILPLVLLLYNMSGLLMTTYWNITFQALGGDVAPFNSNVIKASTYVATTIINIYATSAIIFLICRNGFSRRFGPTIHVIAESGLLYTLTSIATFCIMFIPSNGFPIVTAINFPIAGIAFNLILIRVAQNRASPEPQLPTFIGDSTIERAIPAAPRHNSETVGST
ncbi:hypothetical protein F5887DRAFT_259817 [Amanita rubescens]|nr:hypothetical protein F5887DRAFT_259817 [Amanita rubescens]